LLHLFTIFHLNLAYSSIEEEQRPHVIERCYWPLVRMAEKLSLPFAVEATGYTLETAAALDPKWLEALRRVTATGLCEFVGSGYAQVIGPLVPAEVNAANLRLGHDVYERLLGFRPAIALVNEQAYSAGLIRHYLDAGYRAIVMEWDNPFRAHRDWAPEWRYLPQRAVSQEGDQIPIVWNKSIAFQKFQRYAHAEEELDEYLDYLGTHQASHPRGFSLYGNDIEIFDFRPGRYHTEAGLGAESEWRRIERLFERLLAEPSFRVVRPGEILNLLSEPGAGNRLPLESPEQPVPVKKQGKYNITRWAVTGRDDIGINTSCWRIYEALVRAGHARAEDWRELCYLWSSDFRTHITDARWEAYRERLAAVEQRATDRARSAGASALAHDGKRIGSGITLDVERAPGPRHVGQGFSPGVSRDGPYLTVETDAIQLRLNCRRGLAVDSLVFKGVSPLALCGTLKQGYYDDIKLGADFYTGHVVFEGPGRPKITDLNRVDPIVREDPDGDALEIEAAIDTPLGPVVKTYRLDRAAGHVALGYRLEWKEIPLGSLRLGHVTLKPDAFDHQTLHYRAANGGIRPETFRVHGATIDHGNAVSFLVSATQAVGITDGSIALGDARHRLTVDVDKTASALVGMVTSSAVGSTYFCRLALSACEVDETRQPIHRSPDGFLTCGLRLSAMRQSGEIASRETW
jgi:hypothetical protein